MGLIYLGMTAGFLVVRQMLAGFRKNAVRCLLGLYILDMIITLIFGVAQLIILGNLRFAGDLLGSLVFGCILSIVFLVLNRIYFDNREELFVN